MVFIKKEHIEERLDPDALTWTAYKDHEPGFNYTPGRQTYRQINDLQVYGAHIAAVHDQSALPGQSPEGVSGNENVDLGKVYGQPAVRTGVYPSVCFWIAGDYRPWRRIKNGTAESRVLFAFGGAMNEIGKSFFTYFRSFRDIYIVVAFKFSNE